MANRYPHGSRPPDGCPPLSEIFRQHADGLTGAVCSVLGARAEVAEVLQEAFTKALDAEHRGHRARDRVAWVFVITLNAAKDARRRNARSRTVPLDESHAMELRVEREPSAAMEQRELLDHARSAIAALSDPEKEIFLLRTSGELTFEAAAEALSIPVGTAKTRMRTALKRLRAHLQHLAPTTLSGGRHD